MMKNKQAKDLKGLIANLNLHDLDPDSSFYVEVDEARNAPGAASARRYLVNTLKSLAEENRGDRVEEFHYARLLFAGHRASGKTTELRKVAKELEDCYHVIYVADIEKNVSRFETEQDFLYYLMAHLIAVVKDDQVLGDAVVRDVELLYQYLEDRIFSVVKEERLVSFDHSLKVQAGLETKKSLFSAITGVFAKLSGKAGFEEKTRETITKSIKNYFQEFMEIANSILLHMNTELHQQGKMLLLILDGLDKLSEEKARPLFLNSEVMLPQLECSMIVTFPIYLLYSPHKSMATAPYDRTEPFILSMIKVHDQEGKPYLPGIEAMRRIAYKRFDADSLLSRSFAPDIYPEASFDEQSIPGFMGVLDVAIMMSGGNLRDYFQMLISAAENAEIFGRESVSQQDLVNAMNRLGAGYKRQYAKSFLPIMKEVLESSEKDMVVREDPEDDTLLNIFNAGLLIEYNGERWCDIHPLVRDFIRRQAERSMS